MPQRIITFLEVSAMNIIWQYLDKRKAAENALKDYNSMQYIIDHTDEEIASVSDRMTSLGSPSYSDTPKSGSNPKGNEKRIIKAIDQIDVLKERYRQAVEYMSWFQPAWDALSEDEQYVLKTLCWCSDERQTDAVYDVCDHFHIERTSVYSRKNRAIQHLALLLYGK